MVYLRVLRVSWIISIRLCIIVWLYTFVLRKQWLIVLLEHRILAHCQLRSLVHLQQTFHHYSQSLHPRRIIVTVSKAEPNHAAVTWWFCSNVRLENHHRQTPYYCCRSLHHRQEALHYRQAGLATKQRVELMDRRLNFCMEPRIHHRLGDHNSCHHCSLMLVIDLQKD